MAHSRNKLTVKAIKTSPKGAYGDGGGLLLRKTDRNNGQWIYRFRLHGRQRQMGLGGLSKVSLSKARQIRDEYQALVIDGIDPVRERKAARQAQIVKTVTLADVADIAFVARQAELRADGKAGRWFSPLKIHVLPSLGKRPIVSITQNDIKDTLGPIWHEKADTARKAINRLQIVFKHAVAMGLDVDIQAVEKAKALLGKQRHQVKNIPSMPWGKVPEFFASLDEETPVQLALKFLVLNPGARSKPVRFLRTEDIEKNVWVVPADMMKGQKGHTRDWRTPLSSESLAIIKAAEPFERNGWLFPNQSGKGVISDASMSRLMERRGLEYRPHGFRSSFRTWAAETGQNRDIAERSLAHKIHGKVEASYLRTDFLIERAELMLLWSKFVSSVELSELEQATVMKPQNTKEGQSKAEKEMFDSMIERGKAKWVTRTLPVSRSGSE
ncbi:integrase [Algimonas arctica]|uniref:Integrase n=1 Tax=Algimonas arctica TaxID=1479486 RepID=A0A8J3CQ34_9PROT|nr:integrase arm-type DNA-binding domain-containing protein [Algimonas arctica]GHA90444.1 integrase [Algimonas arctica]